MGRNKVALMERTKLNPHHAFQVTHVTEYNSLGIVDNLFMLKERGGGGEALY